MRDVILSLVMALATAAAGPGARAQAGPDVTVYKSWRPPNITVVEGMFRIDRELLGGAECDYEVQLTVTDSTGTPLVRNDWAGRCPAAVGGNEAAALETFQFAVVPARYTVTVSVQPKGKPAARVSKQIDLVALAAEPVASDLILAREVGYVDAGNEKRWTARRGGVGMLTASRIVAEQSKPSIGYYIEVYPDSGAVLNGALYGVIRRRSDDRELYRLKLQELKSVVDPQPLAGNFSLAGLPPGEYTLEARLELGDTVVRRTHPFEMAGPVVAAQPAAPARSGYFWSLSEEELKQLFDPVVVWLATEQERELYQTLNLDGKREFLSQQFGREEPTPDDGKNSALDEYLQRIRTVNANYAERAGREGVDAWRTDRGRIYLLRGEPVNRLNRPSPPDGSPYELWFYPIAAGYVYVFVDQTRLGDFRLLFTNDPAQPTPQADWYRRLGATALEDIQRFGVRLPKIDGGGGGGQTP